MTYGQQILKARLEHNLTQRELAEIIGSYATIICKYEKDKITPKIKTVVKMADAFNMTVDELLWRKYKQKNEDLTAKEYREREGITIEELAEISGVNKNTIHKAENCCDCKISTIEFIADALHISIDDYIGHKVIARTDVKDVFTYHMIK